MNHLKNQTESEKSFREGLERALNIIEENLESVKKYNSEATAGMILSQMLILQELNDTYDSTGDRQPKDETNVNLDRILVKIRRDTTMEGTFWYGTTASNKAFKGKYQYGILEIQVEDGTGYYGECGDEYDFILDTEDMLYYSGFEVKKYFNEE